MSGPLSTPAPPRVGDELGEREATVEWPDLISPDPSRAPVNPFGGGFPLGGPTYTFPSPIPAPFPSPFRIPSGAPAPLPPAFSTNQPQDQADTNALSTDRLPQTPTLNQQPPPGMVPPLFGGNVELNSSSHNTTPYTQDQANAAAVAAAAAAAGQQSFGNQYGGYGEAPSPFGSVPHPSWGMPPQHPHYHPGFHPSFFGPFGPFGFGGVPPHFAQQIAAQEQAQQQAQQQELSQSQQQTQGIGVGDDRMPTPPPPPPAPSSSPPSSASPAVGTPGWGFGHGGYAGFPYSPHFGFPGHVGGFPFPFPFPGFPPGIAPHHPAFQPPLAHQASSVSAAPQQTGSLSGVGADQSAQPFPNTTTPSPTLDPSTPIYAQQNQFSHPHGVEGVWGAVPPHFGPYGFGFGGGHPFPFPHHSHYGVGLPIPGVGLPYPGFNVAPGAAGDGVTPTEGAAAN